MEGEDRHWYTKWGKTFPLEILKRDKEELSCRIDWSNKSYILTVFSDFYLLISPKRIQYISCWQKRICIQWLWRFWDVLRAATYCQHNQQVCITEPFCVHVKRLEQPRSPRQQRDWRREGMAIFSGAYKMSIVEISLMVINFLPLYNKCAYTKEQKHRSISSFLSHYFKIYMASLASTRQVKARSQEKDKDDTRHVAYANNCVRIK